MAQAPTAAPIWPTAVATQRATAPAEPTVFLIVQYLLPTPTATPPVRTWPATPGNIWISRAELMAQPMSGVAWERLKATADGVLEEPNLAGYTANSDVQTLAVALVYARTGQRWYRERAARAIDEAMGTEYTGRQKGPDSEQGALAVTVGRNLVSYVLAADLIDLAQYDPELDAEFREWIAELITIEWKDGSVVSEDERRANNHGRMAGAARAAVAVYLGDEQALARTARVFRGFLGDREAYAGFRYNRGLSWQSDPFSPVGINPAGAMKQGLLLDGALTEEMRRGCKFRVPPCHTGYPWEGLQGVVVEANILHRQGFDVWHWEDNAILRAVQFMAYLQQEYPHQQWWAERDDTWIPWLINAAYGAEFPTTEAYHMGKNMGWTDWTHAPAAHN